MGDNMNFNIFFKYKKNDIIFNNINIELVENKLTVICGHNGAGKTTLLKVISGILPSGIQEPQGWYVAANGGLIQHFSLKEHLMLVDKNALDNKLVKKAYEYFNAESFENKKINKLSTGQVMMASIIVSIASNQKLILLDEPFGSLDPVNAENLSKLLRELTENDRTVVITAHDLYLTQETADIIYFIKDGKISWDSRKEMEDLSCSVEDLKEIYKKYA